MAVLLEGINIPEGSPITINIYRDGTWINAYTTADGKAVPVPPHGRLIDADAVTLKDGPCEYDDWCQWALRQYQDAPTIIPASEEGET